MNNQVDVVGVRRTSCLDPYIESFKGYLKERSYSPSTIRAYCIRARRLTMMMESRRILPSCLTAELAIELAHGEGRKGSKAYPYTITARQFAKHLIDLGVVLVPSPTPQQIVRKELQHSFENYLHRHRGLSQQTISQNWSFADRFLDHRFGDTDIDLAAISAGDVIAFLQMTISKKVPSRTDTATSAATYLRNFLRYLFKRGLTASNLALCVPRVTKRYNARLPRYLSPDQVETVLAAVRANPTHGRRNHAMLLLQARLGLRAPEVMAIQLGDIDWRAGELTVRGKGQRHDRMPIPPDVGEALTAYIRHDRVSTSRALFVTLRAPYGPFKSGHMLNNFLKKAFAATGVKPPRPYVGSHVLRHSLATNMVRNGASLAEVGDMLRHRSCATTMIYAKLDIDGLRSIAQSWPAVGGVQCSMSLRHELDRYLTVRRSLGYKLATDERVLHRFVDFAEAQLAQHITTALFLRWQSTFGRAGRQTWAARLGIVRLFAQWLHGLDPTHEVPPRGLIPSRHRRMRPYIYSETEIVAIVDAATKLPSVYGMRGLTCSTLFGLIAVTGLRISEALGLDTLDVDLVEGVLRIRHGKLDKERLIPLAESVTERLRVYTGERDRLLGRAPEPFFVTCGGDRLGDCGARYNFAQVCQRIGLRVPQEYRRHGRGPRIHDLRHSFAVRTILDWYRTGKDPSREMLKLTTYLGHVLPENTYWYIEAVPELLELASHRVMNSLDREIGR